MRLVLCLLAAFLAVTRATLVNDEVQRTIDLRSHLVTVATKVTLKNTGDKSVSRFTFQVDPKHASELNYISFTQGDDVKLTAKKDGDSYTVLLPKTLSAGGEASYTAEEVYGNTLTVFPEKITQSQNQLAVYEGNVFFYSPYKTTDQSTTVELPSATVESYTKTHNAEKSDTTIKYEGSDDLENVAPSSSAAMKIHFENNEPFLVVSQLERNIEVSHWGNIAVWEDIRVSHNGAKLKGSFSRYDYQRQQNSGLSSVKSFKTNLPPPPLTSTTGTKLVTFPHRTCWSKKNRSSWKSDQDSRFSEAGKLTTMLGTTSQVSTTSSTAERTMRLR